MPLEHETDCTRQKIAREGISTLKHLLSVIYVITEGLEGLETKRKAKRVFSYYYLLNMVLKHSGLKRWFFVYGR
mgnify:FL=1